MRPYPLDYEDSALRPIGCKRYLGRGALSGLSSRKPSFKLKNAIVAVILDLRMKRAQRSGSEFKD